MKRFLLLLSAAQLLLGCRTDVSIGTSAGTLVLSPLADNAVRVRMEGAPTHDVEELVFTEKTAQPRFSVKKDAQGVTLQLKELRVRYDRQTESLLYYDRGKSRVAGCWKNR